MLKQLTSILNNETRLSARFWKHRGASDIFMAVSSIIISDFEHYHIQGIWCCQGKTNWWYIIPADFKIRKDKVDRWQPFTPIGPVKL